MKIVTVVAGMVSLLAVTAVHAVEPTRPTECTSDFSQRRTEIVEQGSDRATPLPKRCDDRPAAREIDRYIGAHRAARYQFIADGVERVQTAVPQNGRL